MLTTTFALAALTGWSYAGFVADPPPARRAEVAVVAPPAEPFPPSPAVLASITPPETGEIRRPVVEVEPPPTAAARYRLADLAGQVWEHADPATLQAFVIARNAQLIVPAGPAPRFRFRPRR